MGRHKGFNSSKNKIRVSFELANHLKETIRQIKEGFSFELNKSNIDDLDKTFIKENVTLYDSGWTSLNFTPSIGSFTNDPSTMAQSVNFQDSFRVTLSPDLIPFMKVNILARGNPDNIFLGARKIEIFNRLQYNTDASNWISGNPFKPDEANNDRRVFLSQTRIFLKKAENDSSYIVDTQGAVLLGQLSNLSSTTEIQIRDLEEGGFKDVALFTLTPADIEVKIVAQITNSLYWNEKSKYKK